MHKLLLLCSIFFSSIINAMTPDEPINEAFMLAVIHGHNSVHSAAQNLSAIACVSKSLERTSNNKNKCLACIKGLAQKFKKSDMHVCKILQTPAARQRFLLQRQLSYMCIFQRLDKEVAKIIMREEADFNFTEDDSCNLPINNINEYGNMQQSAELILWLVTNGSIPNPRLLTEVFSSHNIKQIYRWLNHPLFEIQLNSNLYRLKTTLLTIFLESNIPVLDVKTLNDVTNKLLQYGANPYFIEYKNRSALYYSTITYWDQKTSRHVTKVNAPLHSLELSKRLEEWVKKGQTQRFINGKSNRS